ncbi:sulfur carrier protein ThiS [Veillonella magna]|uniref:sulfur carrier protein ThiS n=1 Tax=Veillonella magna TaxID=464322 RepID=UPI0023F4C226|nr:sulfur carrier protein ThiS [Veillonella magna]MBD8975261.1 sulfur carrier protein ThiS [Veillonella magna]
MVRLLVNGNSVEIAEPISLAHWLESKGYGIKTVAVELNGTIVEPELYEAIVLSDGMQVEIVSFVGGG